MDFFNKLAVQLKALWDRWSVSQRLGMLVALLVSAASIVGVARWAATPEYVFLSDHLGAEKSAEIVGTLETENIKYQLNYAGTAISVARSDIGRARLALKDVISPAPEATDDMSNGLWTDPTSHQARMIRQLETRLAHSIGQLAPVRGATVHLTQADNSRFVRSQSPSKASVILDLQPGAMFSGTDARAIIMLVANSVSQLDPENVSVLDTSGRLLSGSQGVDADVTGQLGYRSRVEADLTAKAQTMLTQMLGSGRAVVQVTADVDFTRTETKETRYDPESKVKKSEKIISKSEEGAVRGSRPPGTKENTEPSGGSASTVTGGSSKDESTETEYENATTVDSVLKAPGRIKRLTIAAAVQLPQADPAAAANQAAPPVKVTREQIEGIVKQAVGFDSTRGDAIEVLETTLIGNVDLLPVPSAGSIWERYGPMLRGLSLGLASLVALVLGLLVIRRMKPIVVETESKETLSADMVLRLADLSQQARQHPAAAATVIRAWLDQRPAEQKQKKKAAA